MSRCHWPQHACRQLLPVLEGMHQLRALNLKHVPLSEEQRRELRERLPRCSIEF